MIVVVKPTGGGIPLETIINDVSVDDAIDEPEL